MYSNRTYLVFLGDIKARITAARIKAARSVNSELIQLYWDIGRRIVENQQEQGWGKSVVEMLSRDLKKAFPEVTGFSADNLWRMRQFFLNYSLPEFLEQVVPETETRNDQNLEQNVPETAEQPAKSIPGVISERIHEILGNVPWGHHLEILKKPTIFKPKYIICAPPLNSAGAGMFCLTRLRRTLMNGFTKEKRRIIFPPFYLNI